MNPVSSLIELLPILFIALVATALLARLAKPAGPQFARKRFLTDNETRVLSLLETALPEHRIMAQVAMGALLKADGGERGKVHAARNRFSQKIVDFAVVTRDAAEVVALVELDDRTHSQIKDAKRDAMTAAAGYRTIRIPNWPLPTAQSVRDAVAHLATTSPAARPRLETAPRR